MIDRFGLLLLIAFGLQPGRSKQSVHEEIEITASGSTLLADGESTLVRRTGLQGAMLPIPPALPGGSAAPSDSELVVIRRTGAQDSVVATAVWHSPSFVEQSIRRTGPQESEVDNQQPAFAKPESTNPVHGASVENSAHTDPVQPESVYPEAASVAKVDKVRLCGQKCADVIEGGAPCDAFYASGCKGPPPKGFSVDSTLYELCPIACGPEPGKGLSSSLVWLLILLLVLFSPCIIIGLAAGVLNCFLPKTYVVYKSQAQQVLKSWQERWKVWKYGTPYEYDEWEDEDNGSDEDNDESFYDQASASAVMEESQSMSQSMSGSTMMPDASGTTMMPGASATTMMPDASATTMMQSGTTMMPDASATTMMQSSATMMQSSATMMQSGIMEDQPTMMMQSGVMQEQPTMMMQPTMMGSSMMDSSSTDTL